MSLPINILHETNSDDSNVSKTYYLLSVIVI